MRTYVSTFVGSIAVGLAAVVAVNAFVDPFGILPSPRLEGVNVPKTEVEDRARLSKAHAVRWIEPTGVILGSSAAMIGFDPHHPGWKTARPYNLALPGGSVRDCRRHLEHALALGPLDEVVLALELPMFNAHFQVAPDFDEGRLLVNAEGERVAGRPLEPFRLLLSMETLAATGRTLRHNLNAAPGVILWPDGRFDLRREAEWNRQLGGIRKLFAILEKAFLRTFFFPPPARQFGFEDPESGRSTFDELEQIFSLARRHGIELHLLLSPTHVRMREVAHAAGLGSHLERWTRAVTEAAAASGVPLFDFSGYHPFTTEELPPSGDETMRWYFDPTHFKKNLGDLVLDRIFGHEEPGREVPEDFGIPLTPANVDARIEQARRNRERYRAAHAVEIEEIEEWARRAEADRRAESQSPAQAPSRRR